MTQQEKNFFIALTKDRADSADMLEKPSMRGIKNSVVEKYSDQAHFIYELLQNADDAHATSVKFVLEPTRLLFSHNGTRLFSISDPANEETDSQDGKIGDINAITSIANSNKTGASIGKFGVGFKAVFQYTTTPFIYDPNFHFKIERFIVPKQLKDDFPTRLPDETLFVFPFDHSERSDDEAYDDISNKLKNLTFPLLFLSGLQKIEYEFGDVKGEYSKSIVKTHSFDDITADLICLTQDTGENLSNENLWLFSRTDGEEFKYSVGFFLDENNHLRPVDEPAFCFFPTKEVTGLHFIIHAPFLLTDSREGIRAGIPHNEKMIQSLSILAADAILLFKDLGEMESQRFIDDSILEIIPYNGASFSSPFDRRKVSFHPFFDRIRSIMRNKEIIPAQDGYVCSKNAYWAAVPQLTELFTSSQLSLICENSEAKWVFTSLGRDELLRTKKELATYIDLLVNTYITEDTIIGKQKERESRYSRFSFDSRKAIPGITETFIEAQSISWLHTFYKWISETKHRRELVHKKPIFLNQDRKATAAFDKNGQPILFLPSGNDSGYDIVYPELLENPDTKEFIDDIGIKLPSLRDQIYNTILPLYKSGVDIDTDSHFKLFFDYFCKCSNEDAIDFIDLIKDYEFLLYFNENDEQMHHGAAETMYLPSSDLRKYFSAKADTRFVALDEYLKLIGKSKEWQIVNFLTKLGVKTFPSLYLDSFEDRRQQQKQYYIDGLIEIIDAVEQKKDKDYSHYLWEKLCLFISEERLTDRVTEKTIGIRRDARYHFKLTYEPSDTAIALRNKKWIITNTGEYVAPSETSVSNLSNEYDLHLKGASELVCSFVKIVAACIVGSVSLIAQ